MPLQVNLALHGSAGEITDALTGILNPASRRGLRGRRPREDMDEDEQHVEVDRFGRPPLRRPHRDQCNRLSGQVHSVGSRTHSACRPHDRSRSRMETSDVRRTRSDGTPSRPIGARVEPVSSPVRTGIRRPRPAAPGRPPAPASDQRPPPPVQPRLAPPAVSPTPPPPRRPFCVVRSFPHATAGQPRSATEADTVDGSGARRHTIQTRAPRAADTSEVPFTRHPMRQNSSQGLPLRAKEIHVDSDAQSSSSSAEPPEGHDDPAASSAANEHKLQSRLQPGTSMTSCPSRDSPSLDYLIPWEHLEIPSHPIKDAMKQYIQWIASHHKLNFQRSTVLAHDMAWDRGLPQAAELLPHYYILHSAEMNIAEVTAATHKMKVIFFAHATTEGGLRGILHEKSIHPMESHQVPQCGVFYARGHELWGDKNDVHNISRVVHNAWHTAKNQSKLLVIGRAWGTLKKKFPEEVTRRLCSHRGPATP